MSIQRNWTMEEVVDLVLTIKRVYSGEFLVTYKNLSGCLPADASIDNIRESFVKNYETIEKLTEWRSAGTNYQLADTAFEWYLS